MKNRIVIANFLFLVPFCLVGMHGLFLHSGEPRDIERAVILSMSVYSAVQVGGVWLVSWLSRSVLREPMLWLAMRVVGGLLFLISKPIPIVIGAGLMGLSQSLFYRRTREMVGEICADNRACQDQAYLGMTLATNLAFFILPPLGAFLVKYLAPTPLMVISLTVAAIGVNLVPNLSRVEATGGTLVSDNEVLLNVAKSRANMREILVDLLLLASFVIPYGVMMALIPLKAKHSGWGIEGSGLLIGLNAMVVLCVLMLKIRSGKELFNSVIFDRSLTNLSIAAWVLVLTAALLPFHVMIISYIAWSVLEAIQLPALERHIFSNRTYSPVWIDRIFLMDAAGSFLAPLLAAFLATQLRGVGV